ncbi:MAG: ATP-dependent helicase [Phycisphaerae bacterium]|nr:ATP-dependent helicase [Phycisphaerae bacterium]
MRHEGMIEWFACNVCGKPIGLDHDECHSTIGRQNPLCNAYKCCRIKEKSPQQLDYAGSGIDKNIFLKACPGSGKTEVVGLKAAYETKCWDRKVGGVAVLTFTNNAADVIHERVCQFAGVEKAGYPHFVGTFDSWLHGYIAHPFGHAVMKYAPDGDDRSIRLINDDDDDGWLNAYKLRTAYSYLPKDASVPRSMPLYANMIRYDYANDGWEIRVPGSHSNKYVADSEYYSSQAFSLFRKDKSWLTLDCMRSGFKEVKDAFHAKGFATYQDVENICFGLLSAIDGLAENLSKRFPLIIVDECQDLSWVQLQILKALKDAGCRLHFVGDLNQAIYEFKKAEPKSVSKFVKDNGFDEMPLSDNFRSCQGIVDVCKSVVDDENNVEGMSEAKLTSPCLFVTYEKGNIHLLPQWFADFVAQKGLDVSKSAIVARGWSTVSKLRPSGDNKVKNDQLRLVAAIDLWRSGDIQAIGDAVKYMGQFVAHKLFPKYVVNAREYYCPECVTSAIQWRLFLARLLDSSIQNSDIADLNQTWPEWAKNVRTCFHRIANESRPMLSGYLTEDFGEFQPISFNALKTKAKKDPPVPVSDSLGSSPQPKANVRITTIHNVKGETLEAVMLVSSITKSGEGGHWTHWLEDKRAEAARFAYVASSRPKHLLIWAIPKQENADYTRFKELGLKPLSLGDSSG